MSQDQPAQTLTVLVPDQTIEAVPPSQEALQPGEVEEHAFGWVRRWFVKDVKVPLDRAKEQFSRVESEVDELLGSLAPTTRAGYHLTEVQVSVGVSAQGTIAVVSAGVTASLTLVYSKA